MRCASDMKHANQTPRSAISAWSEGRAIGSSVFFRAIYGAITAMHRWTLILLVVTLSAAARAQSEFNSVSFAAKVDAQLRQARYMEEACEPVMILGWEGLETKRCAYNVTDTRTGTRKSGLVIMLNPTSLRLSTWLFSACAETKPQEPTQVCVERLFSRVINQSGAQFPISGVVYEDNIPRDGIQEAYGFRNGVTVLLSGLKHRDTTPIPPSQREVLLTAKVTSTASEGAPARVIGVTRSQYLKANPGANVEGLNWLSVVAAEHKAAMTSDRNALIEAWLRSAP
jgi:hypothetical protein